MNDVKFVVLCNKKDRILYAISQKLAQMFECQHVTYANVQSHYLKGHGRSILFIENANISLSFIYVGNNTIRCTNWQKCFKKTYLDIDRIEFNLSDPDAFQSIVICVKTANQYYNDTKRRRKFEIMMLIAVALVCPIAAILVLFL